MPYKPIPCPGCSKPVQRGGRGAPQTGLCWDCWLKAGQPKPSKGQFQARPKPTAAQKIHYQRRSDQALLAPSSSWWATAPRDRWGAIVEQERIDRLQAGGCSVPKSQQPYGE